MPNNHRRAVTQETYVAGRPKLPGVTSLRAPIHSRIAGAQPVKPRMPAASVTQRQAIKPVRSVPAQAKRSVAGGMVGRSIPTANARPNPYTNRHSPPIAQAKVAQPRAPQQHGVRPVGMTPQKYLVQPHGRQSLQGGIQTPTRVASPLQPKCGCGQAHAPSTSTCACHTGVWGNSALQLAKKKKPQAPPKSPKWLKTWRNIKCYARDTALAMEKHMIGANQIEEYLKAFLVGYRDGVRGHCSEAVQADAQPSAHTDKDLEAFHSYHREHKPYGRRK